ncbi:MAG: hypothetical protein ACRDSJ_21235, partial [Rubrobacteraceae bacterium]
EVEVITSGEVVGADLEGMNKALFYQRAGKRGTKLTPFTQLLEVEPRRARVKNGLTQEERWIEADAVVPVIGRLSREDLFIDLMSRENGVRIQRVGDCVAPRLLGRNITEAYLFSREL